MKDLISDLPRGLTGLERTRSMNTGRADDRMARMAAFVYAEDLNDDGYCVISSVGPCVLGFAQEAGVGFNLVMVGPSGIHEMTVSHEEQKSAGQVVTGRVRCHWLGFLENNGVEVPMKLKDDASRVERLERVKS